MSDLPIQPTSLRDPADDVDFDRLHPSRVADNARIRRLLGRVRSEAISLRRGLNKRIDPETAWIREIGSSTLEFETRDFESDSRPHVFLSFLLDGQPHFFSAPLIERGDGTLVTGIPAVVYLAERRDHLRRPPNGADSRRVSLTGSGTEAISAEIADVSVEGLGVVLDEARAPELNSSWAIRFIDGDRAGERAFGEVRQREACPDRVGWTRIGLGVSASPRGMEVKRESLQTAVTPSVRRNGARRLKVISAGVQMALNNARERVFRTKLALPEIRVVDFENTAGESIRAIVDSWGPSIGATTVVIPPAWGRTKESLMPLASCLVAAFRGAGQPIVVIRFDGIRKKGESFNEPDCQAPGADHHKFTFSQGVRDIQATLDFLDRSQEFKPSSTLLISFSAASIESRAAVAADPRIDGWISVVGAADLQQMMRVISGGVDFAAGMARGMRFGMQEILGIEVDMDLAGLDAIEHQLVYMEDSRRDMAAIHVPVTWIHGSFDAWMDSDRALDILSRGDSANRRFIEVPTGHMLKTSGEALETFQLISREVARISLGQSIEPKLPDLAALDLRRRAERQRLPARSPDLQAFWKDYLIGRDETLGIELMHSITPYRNLMEAQVAGLALTPGCRVADLGCGTGAFPRHLIAHGSAPNIQVIALDYVREGLKRARSRILEGVNPGGLRISFLECDLDTGARQHMVPIRSESVDAVLAALLISYVSDPHHLLTEMMRILKPGGRLVLSCLRKDADMSRLYTDGIAELRKGQARELLGAGSEKRIDAQARAYLNQASRLLDFEEDGTFRFWDAGDIEQMAERAGFISVTSQRSLGSPPQAVVVSAQRPPID
jgi:ubiquinone/menaquinone biosynthesis C-methylase UbiE/pimeloyl-ACP methyl ester carboxylesterase